MLPSIRNLFPPPVKLSWRHARKLSQISFLFIFIILLLQASSAALPSPVVNLPFRLNPLTVLAQLISSRTFLAGSSTALVVVGLTLIFGRAWCGWVCPTGTLLEWFQFRSKGNKVNRYPEYLRSVKYFLLIAILISAVFTNLSLLVLDPLTILFRTFTLSIFPALDYLFTALEVALYPIPGFAEPLTRLDLLLRPSVFPFLPAVFRYSFLFGLIFLGIIALNLVAPRFWCRAVCPLGGLLGLISRVAFIRPRADQQCNTCGLCARSCTQRSIHVEKGFTSSPSECILCFECLDRCPKQAINLRLKSPRFTGDINFTDRRQIIKTFGLTFTALLLARSGAFTKQAYTQPIYPPGGLEHDILSKCIRCGECLRSCPTNGLQPALTEAGLEGILVPVLIPRSGYCDYSCSRCGQVCPVEAIPPLDLEAKRQQVIGKAFLNQDRCIAWADHQDCIVCEEMCPVPQKAIELNLHQVVRENGESVEMLLPRVVPERCIGCGICENKCPVLGEAAIRVFAVGLDLNVHSLGGS